ncbi:MAG: CHAT domain-containing protein [Planctomycetota bacterium]
MSGARTLAAALATLAVVGCGGDDPPTATATPPPVLIERAAADALAPDEAKRLYGEITALLGEAQELRPEGLDDAAVWQTAERIARTGGLVDHEANAIWQRALVHLERGDLDASRAALDDGCERLGDRSERIGPWLFLERAALARREFDFARAVELLDEARLRARSDDGAFRATVEGELGRIYQKLGLLERAALHFERERAAAFGLEEQAVRQAVALHEIRHAEASYRSTEVVRLADELLAGDLGFSARSRAELRLMRAKAELLRTLEGEGNSDRARDGLADALDDPDLRRPLRLVPRAILGAFHARVGDFEAAESALAAAAELHRELAEVRDVEHAAQDGATLHAMWARVTTLRLAAGHLDLARPADRALVGERHARLEQSFDAFVALWSAAPPLPGGVGFLQYGTRASVVGELAALDVAAASTPEAGAERALGRVLRAQTVGSLGRALGATAPTLAEIRAELLAPRRGLLVYLFAHEAGHVLAVGRDSIVHAPLPTAPELFRLRRRLLAEVALTPAAEPGTKAYERAVERAERAATELANALLPDAARRALAGWDEVLVAGVDDLGPFPFAALPDADGRPLGARKAVTHLPSVPVAVALARRPHDADTHEVDLVLLADTEPSDAVRERFPALAPVVLAEDELAALAEPFGTVERYLGPEATRAVLRSELLDRAEVLHVFTHGIYAPEEVEPAGLVLSADTPDDEGILTCADARRLAAPPIVLLSACGAGRTSVRRGEDGVGTFAGAFLSAGARAVVLSPTDLDAGATAALTALVSRELAAGARPAEALRRACAELHQRPEYRHPSFYAPLRVVGLGF